MIPILVTSGKGGTGKTTIAVNLAVNMANRGLRVSFMDADLMTPNAHLFFNVEKERLREAGRKLVPLKVRDNLEFMGLGVFVPRGAGVALNYEKTIDFITTLLDFVAWSGDYLVIDSPPGSIDINVSILKKLRGRARAVVVGEPHVFAIEDNLRMIDVLKLYNIDVRAIVLNKYNIFNEEIASKVVEEYESLGFKVVRVPWDPELQVTVKPELFDELAEVVIA